MTELNHLLALLTVMTLSGMLGGLVNFWSAPKVQTQTESYPLLKRISAGLAASLAVPLFLNMISSSLVADSKSDYLKLVIIAGFCIIASISSKAFIESLAKRLLNQVEQLDKEQKTLRDEVEPVIVKEREPAGEQLSIASRYDLDADDKNVLKELANPKWSTRSTSGIMKATALEDIKAARSLTRLRDLGLARKNTKDNIDWWWLTSEGRSLAKDLGLQ